MLTLGLLFLLFIYLFFDIRGRGFDVFHLENRSLMSSGYQALGRSLESGDDQVEVKTLK